MVDCFLKLKQLDGLKLRRLNYCMLRIYVRFFDFFIADQRLLNNEKLNSIISYLTTKAMEITKERQNILIIPLRVLRALRG